MTLHTDIPEDFPKLSEELERRRQPASSVPGAFAPFVNQKTGEIENPFVEPAQAEIEPTTPEYSLTATTEEGLPLATSIFPSDIALYRMLRYEMPSAELKLQERIQALIEADPETLRLQMEIERSREAVREFETAAAGVFTDDDRKAVGTIRLHTGGVEITWPKPAVYYAMERSLADVYEKEPTLARALGIAPKTKKASTPSFKIK